MRNGSGSHSSHWGSFSARPTGFGIRITPHPDDPEPSPLLENLAGDATMRARVGRPHVRRGWLEHGPGPDERRGDDAFVPMEWGDVLDLLAAELKRVLDCFGPTAVYGSSYGWSSAGRFHHAQSQVHRFLNTLGGYTGSQNTYSLGTSRILLTHVLGSDLAFERPTTWHNLEQHTDLFVAFGGFASKNASVSNGGLTRHTVGAHLRSARRRGAQIVTISPLHDDVDIELDAEWMPVRAGTDTALMLALCSTLVDEGLADLDFLRTHCVGAEIFLASLRGGKGRPAATPEWAESITGIDAEDIRALARRMAASRTMVSVSWSLQRARFGEQPLWAGVALAAVLGQIGLPGGGFGHGYSATGGVGRPRNLGALPTLAQGRNPTGSYIPVARIADMLLHPGKEYEYNGQRRTYPPIELVYWAGGNPFHHHQNLARLARAFRRPSTIVVHEPFWTSTARHADIVLPVTTTLEREDLGASRADDRLIAMHRIIEPYGDSRDDFDIFADLTRRLGREEAFTEGRTSTEWVRHLYGQWQERSGETTPFEQFWSDGEIPIDVGDEDYVLYADFRADPVANPLPTPSGRIELFSETIASFGYEDCPGHPVWLEEERPPADVAAYPLRLIANNPATKLHSQMDHGAYSRRGKVNEREPLRMHPHDAATRSLKDGDPILVTSATGSVLGGLVLTEMLRPGTVQMSTGSWFDPHAGHEAGVTCGHGNVNALTRDIGTSRLTQATSGQLDHVQVARWTGPLPRIRVFDQPETSEASR